MPMRQTIVRATGDQATRAFLERVHRLTGKESRDVLQLVLDRSVRPTSVEDVAADLSLSARQIHRRFGALLLPPPGTSIMWCRAMHVIRLVEDGGRSISQACTLLKFSDPANIRRLIRRLTGLTPREVCDRGGLAHIQVSFLSLIADLVAGRTADTAGYAPITS